MVLEQCCESWRTAKQTQSASIDASNSATAMPNPNFPSSNHRAQFIPARDSRNRAAITRSFGLTWVTGRKPRAHFRFGMVIINPCALHQPREALEIKRHERRQNHLPSPGRKPPFADYVAPYFEKAKVQRKSLARWKMNARQPSAGAIISASCESIKSLRPRNRLFAHPQRSRAF